MSDQIPSQVETFVRDGIGSIAELELLYVTPASVETVFVQMTSRGLLSHGPEGYRFNPRTPEVVETVKALRDLYATRRLKVMEMIYAGPTEKYQSFADAFRLRKNQ